MAEKTDPFLAELQNKLIAQSDLVSSSTSEIESTIEKALSGVETAQKAGAARVESQFDRKIVEAEEAGERNLTSARESQRGFAVNRAALRQIEEQTKKDINDLEQRKQELLLAGESAAAQQVSALQLQSLQFRQQAQQAAFSNMLQMGSFALAQRAEDRLQKSTMATIEFQNKQLDFERQRLEFEKERLDLTDKKTQLEIAKLEKDLNEKSTNLQAESLMRRRLLEDADLDPTSVAMEVGQMLFGLGIDVSEEQFNQLVQDATRIQQEIQAEKDRLLAEEQGNQFFSTARGLFESTPKTTIEDEAFPDEPPTFQDIVAGLSAQARGDEDIAFGLFAE